MSDTLKTSTRPDQRTTALVAVKDTRGVAALTPPHNPTNRRVSPRGRRVPPLRRQRYDVDPMGPRRALAFPKPILIRGRKYRRLAELHRVRGAPGQGSASDGVDAARLRRRRRRGRLAWAPRSAKQSTSPRAIAASSGRATSPSRDGDLPASAPATMLRNLRIRPEPDRQKASCGKFRPLTSRHGRDVPRAAKARNIGRQGREISPRPYRDDLEAGSPSSAIGRSRRAARCRRSSRVDRAIEAVRQLEGP